MALTAMERKNIIEVENINREIKKSMLLSYPTWRMWNKAAAFSTYNRLFPYHCISLSFTY